MNVVTGQLDADRGRGVAGRAADGQARTSLTLPPAADSPRSARRFVLETLRDTLDDDTLDSALLLVTELVTNVVVHAGTEATIDVLRDSSGVRVGVADRHPVRIGAGRTDLASPGVPGLDDDDLDESFSVFGGLREDGRGLALVDALASRWGTEHGRGGKTVWFRLSSSVGAVGAKAVPGNEARLGEAGQEPPEPRAPQAASTAPASAGPGPALAGPAQIAAGPAPAGPVAPTTWATRPASATVARPPRLLARNLARALTAEGEVAELLAQLVDALPVTGAAVRRPRADSGEPELVAVMGRTGPTTDALVFPLDPTQNQLGELLLWPPETAVAPGGAPGIATGTGTASSWSDAVTGETDLDRIRLVTRWMALALGGGDMRRAEERRIGMLSFLAEASDLLAGSLDLDHSLALLARLPVPRLAQWCAVYLRRDNTDPEVCAVGHTEERDAAAVWEAAGEARGALMAAVRAADSDKVRTVAVLGGPALVVALRARRRVLGALVLGRGHGASFSPDDVDLLADLARRAAFAVDNARLYSRQVEVAQALQAGLRPPELPKIFGLDLGAAYRPAQTAGLDVGGDFFDVVPGRHGWTIAIGDVCGKGAEAATVTGVARAVLKLLGGQGHDLGDILLELNRTLRESIGAIPAGAGRFCTVAAASLITRDSDGTWRMALRLAGHPPPVVLRADGSASFAGQPGTLLGVLDDADATFPKVPVSLGRGDALVMYTDGVVEARRGRELFGDERLLRAVAECAGMSAQGIADQLRREAERFAGGALRDDVAILVASVPNANSL